MIQSVGQGVLGYALPYPCVMKLFAKYDEAVAILNEWKMELDAAKVVSRFDLVRYSEDYRAYIELMVWSANLLMP
jgi:hypothetical protein